MADQWALSGLTRAGLTRAGLTRGRPTRADLTRGALATAMALAAILVACGQATEPEPEIAGMCIGVVVVEGRTYTGSEMLGLPADFAPGTPYATVTRYRECQDVIVVGQDGVYEKPDWSPLGEGESNFLPEGTHLYAIPGYPPAERLATRHADGTWFVAIDPENPPCTRGRVNVGGEMYAFNERVYPDSDFQAGDVHASVERFIDCETATQPLEPGDSDYLPAGTRLYTIALFGGESDVDPGQRLAAERPDGVWVVLGRAVTD